MLAGLLIGLFIAFLLYLRSLPVPEPEVDASLNEDSTAPLPTFDFYKILPELEIVIPEVGPDSTQQTSPTSTSDKPAVSTDLSILAPNESLVLQAGSFSQYEQADTLKANLALLGIEASIQAVTINDKQWFRVRVGPFSDPGELNAVKQQLRKHNINTITLKISA